MINSHTRAPYTFAEYQEDASLYAIYKDPMYPVLGLAEETGEVCGKIAKAIRVGDKVDRGALAKELGDVLWNLAMIATEFDMRLDKLAEDNIAKLCGRKKNNTIAGSGDNR